MEDSPSRSRASVVFDAPAGWHEATVPPSTVGVPDDGSFVSLDQWSVWAAPNDGAGRSAVACFGLDLETWADEVTPVALERLVATAGAVAARLHPGDTLRVARTRKEGALTEQTLASASSSPADEADRVVGRTFLGFATDANAGSRLRSCFVLCLPPTGPCERSVLSATVTPTFVAPPPPNLPLRALVVGVHHPREVAVSGTLLFFALGLIAVWTRPRPRRK